MTLGACAAPNLRPSQTTEQSRALRISFPFLSFPILAGRHNIYYKVIRSKSDCRSIQPWTKINRMHTRVLMWCRVRGYSSEHNLRTTVSIRKSLQCGKWPPRKGNVKAQMNRTGLSQLVRSAQKYSICPETENGISSPFCQTDDWGRPF